MKPTLGMDSKLPQVSYLFINGYIYFTIYAKHIHILLRF